MDHGVVRLNCRNFRSYRTLSLPFSEPFVVFVGENGAGKTNILEAISLFSSGRGLRKAPISDLNNLSSLTNSWNLDLEVKINGYSNFLSTNAHNGRRVAKIDGANISSLSKFEDLLWLLWVIPSMDGLFIGDNQTRRKFFDHLVSGFDKEHKKHLKIITNLQKERLHIIAFRKDESWLKVVEEKIADETITVTKKRLNFINIIRQTFDDYPSKFLRCRLDITGEIEDIFINNNEENAKNFLVEKLKQNRFLDSERQTTQLSVQKTFWRVIHERSDIEAANCSTGEQKAFMISLILATTRIYKNCRNGTPVLLLDDLMMHLDKTNRRYLIEELFDIGVQSLFTGTDDYLFKDIQHSVQLFHVKNSICQVG